MPRVIITETEDGPLEVDGQINLIDAARNERETHGKARLCRCGFSSAKPFCDNSHQPPDFGAGADRLKKNSSPGNRDHVAAATRGAESPSASTHRCVSTSPSACNGSPTCSTSVPDHGSTSKMQTQKRLPKSYETAPAAHCYTNSTTANPKTRLPGTRFLPFAPGAMDL